MKYLTLILVGLFLVVVNVDDVNSQDPSAMIRKIMDYTKKMIESDSMDTAQLQKMLDAMKKGELFLQQMSAELYGQLKPQIDEMKRAIQERLKKIASS
ncbi:hypothetical protein FQA39_LY10038 [Lamprigera yunnana]|nr:hypothetical protein FQA39_LY10038 [Lamprigera yunnana]